MQYRKMDASSITFSIKTQTGELMEGPSRFTVYATDTAVKHLEGILKQDIDLKHRSCVYDCMSKVYHGLESLAQRQLTNQAEFRFALCGPLFSNVCEFYKYVMRLDTLQVIDDGIPTLKSVYCLYNSLKVPRVVAMTEAKSQVSQYSITQAIEYLDTLEVVTWPLVIIIIAATEFRFILLPFQKKRSVALVSSAIKFWEKELDELNKSVISFLLTIMSESFSHAFETDLDPDEES